MSKNGINLNLFEKYDNLNNVEEVIPKVNFIPNDIPAENNEEIEAEANPINNFEDKKIKDDNMVESEILDQMMTAEKNAI